MILHILKKDVRRLWPAIAVSLIVLGSLAWHDRWRDDRMVGEIESYLNLLVPLAWACLLALVVEQEPLVGDRQFWITRPYRRRDLLVSKLLFAALFVHLPSLLADCWILKARGFPPTLYLGELLTKQLVLACALTLPAMALASLVRSFSHFVLELVGLAVAVVLLTVGYWVPQADWEVFESVRRQLVMLLGVGAAAAVLAFQYLGRRVLLSRGVALAGGLSAGLLMGFFLPQSALAIRSSMKPAGATLSMTAPPAAGRGFAAWPRHVMSIPVELSGVPPEAQAGVIALQSRIAGSGASYEHSMHIPWRPFERPLYFLSFTSAASLVVNLDPAVFARLKNGPVTISGEAGVTLYRTRSSVSMGTAETRDFGDLGRCTTQLAERRLPEQALKIECESPRFDPTGSRVRLRTETGLDRMYSFYNPRNFSNTPRVSWLSPLHRGTVYIDLVPEGSNLPYELRIPRAVLPTARLEITAVEPLGYAPLKFEFRDLDLQKYIAPQPVSPASAR